MSKERYNKDDHEIDNTCVESSILKGYGRGSPCNMCNFKDWSPGDIKYIVEHCMRDKEKRNRGGFFECDEEEDEDEDDCFEQSREHLCSECAISRGLDYDMYYKPNQNAPIKSKEEIPLSAGAYKKALCRRARASVSSSNKKPRIDDDNNENDVNNNSNTNNNNKQAYLNYMANKLMTSKKSIKACYLRPHRDCPLFVAWNGVIVMVYDGFPPSLIQAKAELSAAATTKATATRHSNNNYHHHLHYPKVKKENFGSKWPKTTLAAVFDNAPEFTMEELIRLKEICYKYGHKFHINNADANNNNNNKKSHSVFGHHHPSYADEGIILINALSFVEYGCRSLEKINTRTDVSLKKNGFDLSTPSDCEKEVVNSVINEWSNKNATKYLSKINNPGSRMNSYRQQSSPTLTTATATATSSESETKKEEATPKTTTIESTTTATSNSTHSTGARSNVNDFDTGSSSSCIDGVTCVTFLNDGNCCSFPDKFRQILIDFRIAVDMEFPGRYAWFAEQSLHCTMRCIGTIS